jgi:glycosyltransferase involved in cell wall biosynthesis
MMKIHFHTDCSFFGGCETMIPILLNSSKLRGEAKLTLSYIYSTEYASELHKRLSEKVDQYPIRSLMLQNPIGLPKIIPVWLNKVILVLLRFFLHYPIIAYQVIVLCRLLNKTKPDILHINNGGYPGARSALAAAVAGKIVGVPKIVMVVNNIAIEYSHYTRWLDFLFDKMVSHSVDLFVTGSQAANDQLLSVLRLPKRRVTSINNGIELGPTKETRGSLRQKWGLDGFQGLVFGTVGLLVPRKGHQVLMEAVKALFGSNKCGEKRFIIIGDGILREKLKAYTKANGLEEIVKFVGHESNAVDFMSAIDILIFPSVAYEDFPNVVLEAMSVGKPVIASRIAGTPEQVIHGQTGYLFDPGNVEQLKICIDKISDNHLDIEKMAKNSVQNFNNRFTSQAAVERYLVVYKKLVSDFRC